VFYRQQPSAASKLTKLVPTARAAMNNNSPKASGRWINSHKCCRFLLTLSSLENRANRKPQQRKMIATAAVSRVNLDYRSLSAELTHP
jgi:hypothetical protein